MPWVDSKKHTVHRFELYVDQYNMRDTGVSCTCGWRQGIRAIALEQSPWVQWEQNHLRKQRRLAFVHDQDDMLYDYEDKEARCACGWTSPPGADFQQSGRAHLDMVGSREIR